MRTEREMFDLILGTAESDERVRAVWMNGSRANPNVRKDQYQDFDIVFVVTETESFLADKNWISVFGDIGMVQEPDWNDLQSGYGTEQIDLSRGYTWLILFQDGNRIDLRIEIIDEALDNILEDKLTVVLLDKDGLLPELPKPTDEDYHVRKPSEGEYLSCCNEFWWCLNNVGKGIARDELPYAMEMYHKYVRDMLNKMAEWYIGIQTEFCVSAGKLGKYFKEYLSAPLYEQYKQTYCDSDYDHIWMAVFTACDLFRILAKGVGEYFSFAYNLQDDENMTAYLKSIQKDMKADKAN